jgi:hypothetical protein
MHDSDGERIPGDGVKRESAYHPVVAGTALGRPENVFEAVMICAPGEEPQDDSEALQASMDRVDGMLALLPVRERQVMTLCVLEGRTIREAATTLGIGKSQVDRDLRRAKATLAELLGGELPSAGTQAALEELAPNEAPELGDYLEPAVQKAELPEVSSEDWRRYQRSQARVQNGTAAKLDFAFVIGFEKRNGLASSFSPAWRYKGVALRPSSTNGVRRRATYSLGTSVPKNLS